MNCNEQMNLWMNFQSLESDFEIGARRFPQ